LETALVLITVLLGWLVQGCRAGLVFDCFTFSQAAEDRQRFSIYPTLAFFLITIGTTFFLRFWRSS
jgi:hypothetical protein